MKSFSQKNLLRNGLVFLLFGCVSNTSIAQQSSSYELWKGVVVDSTNKLIYTSNPNGGMDGINISVGNKAWHTAKADRPIVVYDSKLIAQHDSKQAGTLSLVSIESASGNISESHSIELPSIVVAQVADSLNNHFNIREKTVSPSSSNLEWQFRKETVRGTAPTAPENNLINSINTTSKTNKENIHIFGEVTFNGNNNLATSSSRVLSQMSTSTNSAIEGKFLVNKAGRQFKSVSGNHVMVSTRKSDPSLREKYQWDIYNLTGQLLGSINNSSSYISFDTVDDVILFMSLPYTKYIQNTKHEAPLALQAYSLSTGQKLWQHEIRDMTYKGPYPQ
jgi:hypothetical protein